MVEIPIQKLTYSLNEKKFSKKVNQFYLSKYPESNLNYKLFLRSLSKDQRPNALPQKQFLKKYNLDNKQIKFLISEYYSSNTYDQYPIVGLSKTQIKNYLDWKSDHVGKEILKQNGIIYDSNKTYLEIIQEQKINPKHLQVNYNVLMVEQAISARKYLSQKKSKIKISNVENKDKMISSLGLMTIEYYDIEKYYFTEDLIYSQLDDGNYYESVHRKNSNIFETNSKMNILVPLRTWHPKI